MFQGRRCIVTGGTGLVGRKVVDQLIESGADVTSISLEKVWLNRDCHHVYADLRDFNRVVHLLGVADYVFHIAGLKTNPRKTKECPATFLAQLLQINTNVLEACRINAVPHLVFTSSIGAYPNREVLSEEFANEDEPMDGEPGWAKRMAERLIFDYEVEFMTKNYHIARLGTVYGEGDNFNPDTGMVIPSLVAKIHRGDKPVEVWGDGEGVRDFTYSTDIARGLLQLAQYEGMPVLVNLASGKGVSIKQLIHLLHDFIEFEYIFSPGNPSGQAKRVMNIEKAQRLIGYQPRVSLQEGLQRTWKWYLIHHGEAHYDPFAN